MKCKRCNCVINPNDNKSKCPWCGKSHNLKKKKTIIHLEAVPIFDMGRITTSRCGFPNVKTTKIESNVNCTHCLTIMGGARCSV